MITKQPHLKCCANCFHFNPGWDGRTECMREYSARNGGEVSIDATDICEHFVMHDFDVQEIEVR